MLTTVVEYENFISKLKIYFNKLEQSVTEICTILILLNALVFFAWQLPTWRHFMVQYFTVDAHARRIRPSSLLLSAFSHKYPRHFCLDMISLHAFCRGVLQPRGEMEPEEFIAMYISGCFVSSLANIIFRRSFQLQGNFLGSSGAIYSVLGYLTLSNPEEKLKIIFLPIIQFDAIYALFAIISSNILGLLIKRNNNHGANLGGTLFGMFWYMSTYAWRNRR